MQVTGLQGEYVTRPHESHDRGAEHYPVATGYLRVPVSEQGGEEDAREKSERACRQHHRSRRRDIAGCVKRIAGDVVTQSRGLAHRPNHLHYRKPRGNRSVFAAQSRTERSRQNYPAQSRSGRCRDIEARCPGNGTPHAGPPERCSEPLPPGRCRIGHKLLMST